LQLHENSNGKIEIERRRIMVTLIQPTTTTTRWTCNELEPYHVAVSLHQPSIGVTAASTQLLGLSYDLSS
jgi:hypothetical protein